MDPNHRLREHLWATKTKAEKSRERTEKERMEKKNRKSAQKHRDVQAPKRITQNLDLSESQPTYCRKVSVVVDHNSIVASKLERCALSRKMSWGTNLLLFGYKHRKAILYINIMFWPVFSGVVLMEFIVPTKHADKPISTEHSMRVSKMLDDLDKKTTRQKLEDAAFALDQMVNPTISGGPILVKNLDNKSEDTNG